jgi:hypothetical protein
MAVMAGASGPTSIAEWAVLKEELLLKLLLLPNVESQETCGDTNLYSQNASASESSEKQCSSSFPYWPAGISVLVVFGEDCTPTGCANARVETGTGTADGASPRFRQLVVPKRTTSWGGGLRICMGVMGNLRGHRTFFPKVSLLDPEATHQANPRRFSSATTAWTIVETSSGFPELPNPVGQPQIGSSVNPCWDSMHCSLFASVAKSVC